MGAPGLSGDGLGIYNWMGLGLPRARRGTRRPVRHPAPEEVNS